jgi:hypothetical protein
MARGPSNSPNRRPPAKKTPAKGKRAGATAPTSGTRKRSSTKGATTAPTRVGKKAVGKASKKMGKPKTASTASHKGASTPAKRSPKMSRRRAATAQSKNDAEAPASDGTPGAIGPRVVVENVNVPGYRKTVDGARYGAIRDALLAVLPSGAPGMTQDEMAQAVAARVRGDLKQKAMWWTKTVQLDLEAKGEVARERSKPLRWHRA